MHESSMIRLTCCKGYVTSRGVYIDYGSKGIYHQPWRQKIAILIRMQFLNDVIKSKHDFKIAQKYQSFRVLIKTLHL